jgi:O-antigen/teichoic acid export membrane protein
MELVRGAARALGGRALGALAALALSVAVARLLGRAEAGVYFLGLTLVSIASVLGRLGLDQLLVRRAAAAAAGVEPGRLASTARQSLLLAGIGSAAVAFVLFVGADFLAQRAFGIPPLGPCLRILAPAVVPLSLVTLFGELLRGVGRPGLSQLLQSALPAASALLCLWLLQLSSPGAPERLAQASAAYSAGCTLAALVALLVWRRRMRAFPVGTEPSKGLGLAAEAVPFLGVALLSLALPWISVLWLAFEAHPGDVGIFSAAYRAATLPSFALLAVNCVVAPRFAALSARADGAGLARTARRAALLTTLVAAPLCLCAWTFPTELMGLFGPEYRSGGRALAILATGQCVNVLTGSVGALLLMTGHERALRQNLLFAVLASVLLHALLVPRLGLDGAALASAGAIAVLNLGALSLVRRHLAIDLCPIAFLSRTEARP